ncbi:transglutaminase family protein [Patescibacteria group bacterium]
MRKTFKVLFFLLGFFFYPTRIFAAGQFTTAYKIIYKLKPPETDIEVLQEISLTNLAANVYPSEYTLKMNEINLDTLKASDAGGEIVPEISQNGQMTSIKLRFNQKVTGLGQSLTFQLQYLLSDLVNKNGQVWEITLPRLPDPENLTSGQVILAVPPQIGPPAFITPNQYQQEEDSSFTYFRFFKNQINNQLIRAVFGQFQVFDFSIKYHLNNPYASMGQTEVAFPPDTDFQKVYFDHLSDRPEKITVDPDGNWLGNYILNPKQKKTISLSGWAQIFAQNQNQFPSPDEAFLKSNLASLPYWPSDDATLQEKAKTLKTAQNIYQFVVDHLAYDYSQVECQKKRQGAKLVFEKPASAICVDFTDLFVTLARAAGIPARAINGFAHTTNSRLQPLGEWLDILHAWPQYWDNQEKKWLSIDPTWGNTTGGQDYFSSFDLNHFTFVIHGQDSQRPHPPGSYKLDHEKSKDVQVKVGQYKKIVSTQPKVEFVFMKKRKLKQKWPEVVIFNPGPEAIYNFQLQILGKGVKLSPQVLEKRSLAVFPPFDQVVIPLILEKTTPFQFGQAKIIVLADGQEYGHHFRVESLVWPQLFLTIGAIGLGLIIAITLLLVVPKMTIFKKKNH